MQCQIYNGGVHFLSRSGNDWTKKFPTLKSILSILSDEVILDGEIVKIDREGRSHFQELQKTIKKKKDQKLAYYVFDILFLNGKDLRKMPLLERKKILKHFFKKVSPPIFYSDHIFGKAEEFFKISCDHKLEGIVSKLKDSTYFSGRNNSWCKTKCSMRQEFVIGGWVDSKAQRTGFGALLLGVFEKNKLRYVGRVGTGFSHDFLHSFIKDLKQIEQSKSPFYNLSRTVENLHWVRPVKVCEVSFSQWTETDILRNPVFKGLREDKNAEEIFKETMLILSSPDKVLFKQENITKKDVLDYYIVASPFMLPHIKDRPLTIVRCPSGTGEKCFFQKKFKDKNISPNFHLFISSDKAESEHYISINSQRGVLDLIQLNGFEIHTWNCKVQNSDYPDLIVIDFDPDSEVAWSDVISTAFELKKILDQLNLKSFVKLSGGKGLHVHIPIAPIYNWDEIKLFSKTISKELCSRYPDKLTINMSKKRRKGKIFIDYFRNSIGATSVAPYSLRTKDKTTVAMPIEWHELHKTISADQYDLKKSVKKIKNRKRDPWSGMIRSHQRIEIIDQSRSH